MSRAWLIRRVPPALFRCHVVVDSSLPEHGATESHNDWTITTGSPHHAAYLTDRETDRRRLPAGAAQPHSPTTPARITTEYGGTEYGGLPVNSAVFVIPRAKDFSDFQLGSRRTEDPRHDAADAQGGRRAGCDGAPSTSPHAPGSSPSPRPGQESTSRIRSRTKYPPKRVTTWPLVAPRDDREAVVRATKSGKLTAAEATSPRAAVRVVGPVASHS